MTQGSGPVFGARPGSNGTRFAIWSGAAERAWLCLFDEGGEAETGRIELTRNDASTFCADIPNLFSGDRYGIRMDGPFDPTVGHRFDPSKLLVDPYAYKIDRPFAYDPRLASPREANIDTAPMVPKSVVTTLPEPKKLKKPSFVPGGLIYELNVRGFTMRHPEVAAPVRGTVAALAEPAILEHLQRLGVGAVELMPIAAWIDERHLPPLGLSNAWGYNPVAFMALDPRICPGGLEELARTTECLQEAGISVILDVVFNHTGESDDQGPTLSLRGIDNAAYFRHTRDGIPINDTGCGNTLACDRPIVRQLILDSLRHFAIYAGVDGYRFDLGPILGRSEYGFSRNATLFAEMAADPILSTRIMIAEPWDLGPGGYQLGGFPDLFLEWNDRYRDRVRKFWRGDGHMLGETATALAGSSDVFSGDATRTVNFIAAHDGFPLADLTRYAHKHNDPNGEDNRDGHNDNLSWNHGVEGSTEDESILVARRKDVEAMLAMLFISRGTIMLTAGDEFGRTQHGNNNAYAQDNETTWIDWENRNLRIEQTARSLSAIRQAVKALHETEFLTGERDETGLLDVEWIGPDGLALKPPQWESQDGDTLGMLIRDETGCRLAVLVSRSRQDIDFKLPSREGHAWTDTDDRRIGVACRSVRIVQEMRHISNTSQ
ncbi:MAG: glycogen debranching protein GlgX [Pseudomonadota bacterium]